MEKKKMLDFRRTNRSNMPLFSTISFVLIILIIIILADSLLSNLSIHSVASSSPHHHHHAHHHPRNPLLLVKEESEEGFRNNPLVPPVNLTAEERIAWFRTKLTEFDILNSYNNNNNFTSRVQEFFGGQSNCESRFFMTWLSPANSFGPREFLALESLFKSHPNGCLLILSRTMDSPHGNRLLTPLTEFGFRVLSVSPDLSFLFENTPAETWLKEIKSGSQDPGEIPLAQNLSNLIRLAVLYKYGGIYLDTDFIVLRKFSNLRNSIGAQSVDVSGNWTRLNNAVLIFDKNHPLLYKFIEEFATTFDGNKWGHNGPYLVSRVIEREANNNNNNNNFSVLPPMAFYPVDWTRIGGLFLRPGNRAHSRWVEAKIVQLRRMSYGVHLWNKQSGGLGIEEGSIVSRLFKHHCVICNHIVLLYAS